MNRHILDDRETGTSLREVVERDGPLSGYGDAAPPADSVVETQALTSVAYTALTGRRVRTPAELPSGIAWSTHWSPG